MLVCDLLWTDLMPKILKKGDSWASLDLPNTFQSKASGNNVSRNTGDFHCNNSDNTNELK